jgi:hypothetical protein
MGNNIEQWDRPALEKLMEHGAMTAQQLGARLDSDAARAWVDDALARGLIEETGGSDESARYNITDAGRKAIDVPTGR